MKGSTAQTLKLQFWQSLKYFEYLGLFKCHFWLIEKLLQDAKLHGWETANLEGEDQSAEALGRQIRSCDSGTV